jgi:Na+-transporting methylmalonyl-CoA/oxaloacetate decarboxylase gamma subunit
MMGDVVMVLVILAFFVVCIGYVTWCGRIIGPDPEAVEQLDDDTEGADPAALATAGRS